MNCTAFLHRFSLLSAILLSLIADNSVAEVYRLENTQDSVVGQIQKTRASSDDTLLDIARANGLGYHEIKRVNPTLDTWLPETDREIILPSRYVLPSGARKGIILNIPEMRLYYFPPDAKDSEPSVITYPLGIGREGWQTPYTGTRVIQKKKNPAWHPPESIRKEHEEAGDPLPKRVAPGPDNPLGDYALRLGLPGYLIHGTNKPFGIGMRVSHGCIRLYPEDIEELFPQVKLKTRVNIINQPYKVGRLDDKIYLEAHPYLEEDEELFRDNLTSVVKMIVELTGDTGYQIEWDLAKQVIHEMKGIPVLIGRLNSGNTRVAQDEGENSNIQGVGISLQLETGLVD